MRFESKKGYKFVPSGTGRDTARESCSISIEDLSIQDDVLEMLSDGSDGDESEPEPRRARTDLQSREQSAARLPN